MNNQDGDTKTSQSSTLSMKFIYPTSEHKSNQSNIDDKSSNTASMQLHYETLVNNLVKDVANLKDDVDRISLSKSMYELLNSL